MYQIEEYIKKELVYQTDLQKRYAKQLEGLPEGRLAINNIEGKLYYYKMEGTNRKYLGTSANQEVQALQKRHLITETLKRTGQNQKLMEDFLQKYKSVDVNRIIAESSRAYQPPGDIELSMRGQQKKKQWGDQPYKKNNSYPERLVHRTLKGDLVRSKSEAIIANMLFHNNIPYHYEEVINIGGHNIAPDFLLYVESQQKYKIIEHFGMIGDKDYLEKCVWKIKLYLENGYTPWEDVIFTFDDANGNLDTRMIDNIINAFCK